MPASVVLDSVNTKRALSTVTDSPTPCRYANLPVVFSGDRFRSRFDGRETSSGVGDAVNSSVDVFRTGDGRCENRNAVLDSVDNSDEDIVSADGIMGAMPAKLNTGLGSSLRVK